MAFIDHLVDSLNSAMMHYVEFYNLYVKTLRELDHVKIDTFLATYQAMQEKTK